MKLSLWAKSSCTSRSPTVKSHLGEVTNQLATSIFTVQQFLYVSLAGLGPEQRAALRYHQESN